MRDSQGPSRASAIPPALWCLPLLVLALGSFRQAAVVATVAALLLVVHRVPPFSTLKGARADYRTTWSRLLLACAAAWVAGQVPPMFISHSLPLLSAAFQLAVFLAAWFTLRGPAVHPPRAALVAVVVLGLLFQSVVVVRMARAANQGDVAAAEWLRHPTRATLVGLSAPSLPARGGWIEHANRLAPLHVVGEDAFREVFHDDAVLKNNSLANLALLGGDLRIRSDNRAVSLDYNPKTDELAVLREHGELLLISSAGRRLHASTGDLGKASRVRTTPDGAGFLCLFERGETRYFGADSPYACTGGMKYGLGRAVDLAFDPDGDPRPFVLSAVGGVYQLSSATASTEITPPLFPGVDRARGLAVEAGKAGDLSLWVLDCHGRICESRDPTAGFRFQRHAFPAPDDDAVALRAWKNDLLWLDAWGGLHGCHGSGDAAFAYGDLALRVRRGDCVDFVVMPELGRVLVLNGYGEIASYDLGRYAQHPNPEPAL